MAILKINMEWKKTKNNQNTRRQFYGADERRDTVANI